MHKYYIFWWANIDKGFANGTFNIERDDPITNLAEVEAIQELLRKEVDRPTATIMSWSKFEDQE